MSRERPRPGHPDVLAFPELPVVEPEEDDLFEDDEPPTILITGASGNLGRKLRDAWAERYDLILLDSRDEGDPEVMVADLAVWDEEWVALFDEADAVVHLAANPRETTPWPDLVGPNLDAVANVFHATALSGVERLVFASSNHAMGGYRDRDETPIAPDLPARPGNAYGAAKLVGERFGVSLAQAFGLSFVALRLGWVLPGDNRPGDLPDEWSRGIWLSNADLVRLFTCAVEAPIPPGQFAIVNGISRNRGSRWSLEEAAELLGFEPEDDAYARE
jgi:nucleoside-diphosphate-sugar epimerase